MLAIALRGSAQGMWSASRLSRYTHVTSKVAHRRHSSIPIHLSRLSPDDGKPCFPAPIPTVRFSDGRLPAFPDQRLSWDRSNPRGDLYSEKPMTPNDILGDPAYLETMTPDQVRPYLDDGRVAIRFSLHDNTDQSIYRPDKRYSKWNLHFKAKELFESAEFANFSEEQAYVEAYKRLGGLHMMKPARNYPLPENHAPDARACPDCGYGLEMLLWAIPTSLVAGLEHVFTHQNCSQDVRINHDKLAYFTIQQHLQKGSAWTMDDQRLLDTSQKYGAVENHE